MRNNEPDTTPRVRIPADIDTPDKIAYGLTARQLAVLTVAALLGYGLYQALGDLLPAPVLIGLLVPIAGAAISVALGRRDGLPLDAWLLAAVKHSRQPKQLAPATDANTSPAPAWAPQTDAARPPAVLRLPAHAISDNGVIDTGTAAVALVAATTVNINLRTGDEQGALLGAYGRWLNGLSGPVQVVISTQRVDLSSHAQRVTDNAAIITNPALAAAARDYATFLTELAAGRDPLWRTITVAVTATGGHSRDGDVARRAEHTATALAALGVQTAVLDGTRVTTALATAVDPYTPTDATWARTRPGAVITGEGS